MPFETTTRIDLCAGCPLRSRRLCRVIRATSFGNGAGGPRLRRLPQDRTLQEEGGAPNLTGVLRRGYLRAERMMPDGRRSILGLLVPGDLVGDWAGAAGSCSLAAATDVEICAIDPRLARRVADEDAALRIEILHATAAQTARQLEMVWRRGALTSRERIIAFLVMAAEIMPVAPQGDGSLVLTIPISRRDWADLTNTTVETICRTLGYLADKDMVRPEGPGRYHVRDLDVLCRLAGLDPEHDRVAPGHDAPAPGPGDRPALRLCHG
nr:Crp/Fnr family transcriptional regulator [Roseibacterium persicicum]